MNRKLINLLAALGAFSLATLAADNPPVIHPKCAVVETNYCAAYSEISFFADNPCCVAVAGTNDFPRRVSLSAIPYLTSRGMLRTDREYVDAYPGAGCSRPPETVTTPDSAGLVETWILTFPGGVSTSGVGSVAFGLCPSPGTCSASFEATTDGRCVHPASTNIPLALVYAAVEAGPWIGLDLTDAAGAPPTDTATGGLTARCPREPSPTVTWSLSSPAQCELVPPDAGLELFSATIRSTPPNCSEHYLGEEVTMSVSHPGVSVSTNFTVVKVDVRLSGVSEEDEERKGGFVQHSEDLFPGWPAGLEATSPTGRCPMATLHVDVQPRDGAMPDELVQLSYTDDFASSVFTLEDGVWRPATNVYRVADLPGTFYIHGHAESSALRDKVFTAVHAASGAIDKASLTVLRLDLDIDSDNDNGLAVPDRSTAEDFAEELSPGKIVPVDTFFSDFDTVPDFADGYGLGTNEAYAVSEGTRFVPFQLTIPSAVDVSNVLVRLEYGASPPADVSYDQALGFIPSDAGVLRIWTTNGFSPRSLSNYVSPSGSNSVSAASLGFSDNTREKTFYLEAPRPSSGLGADSIRAVIDIVDDGRVLASVAEDMVVVTAVDLSIRLPDRDVDDGDVDDVDAVIHRSHPVPRFDDLAITNLSVSADGSLSATVSGVFTDAPSEVLPEELRLQEFSIRVHSAEVARVPVAYTPVDSPWRLVSSETSFSVTFTLQGVGPGSHLVHLSAGPNAAGQTGTAVLHADVVGLQIEPTSVSCEGISMSFAGIPSTNSLDTAALHAGGVTNSLCECGFAVADTVFTGAVCVATQSSLEFRSDAADTFQCGIFTEDGGDTNVLYVTFSETSTNSLYFTATSAVRYNDGISLAIGEAGELANSPKGYFNPFRARIDSSLSDDETRYLIDTGILQILLEGGRVSVIKESDGLFVSDEENGERSRLFAVFGGGEPLMPGESMLAGAMSFSWGDSSADIYNTFEWEIEGQSGAAGLRGGMSLKSHLRGDDGEGEEEEGEEEDPPTWTLEEAWQIYDILFGEPGRCYKRAFLGLSPSDGVRVEHLWFNRRNFRFENLDNVHRPLALVLDSDMPNAAEAARALFEAFVKLKSFWGGGSWFYRYRVSIIEELPGSSNCYDESALSLYEAEWRSYLGEAVDAVKFIGAALETGVSIMAGPGAVVFDLADIADDIEEGDYANAGMTSVWACLGVIGDVRQGVRSFKVVHGGYTHVLPQELADLAQLSSRTLVRRRPETMQLMRRLLSEGKIDRKTIALLYDSGLLKGPSKPPRALRSIKGWPSAAGTPRFVAHHDLPTKFERQFIMSGIDPNTEGRLISEQMHALLHSGKCGTHGGIYNYQWEQFFTTFNNAGLVTDGIHFNPADPAGSIEAFMERLREVTEVMVDAPSNMDEGFDILSLAWPYKP